MAALTVEQLRHRAAAFDAAGAGDVVDVQSTPGGGTLPGVEMDSVGIARSGDHRDTLRGLDRPIIARVEGDTTYVDLRTVHPDDDATVINALRSLD